MPIPLDSLFSQREQLLLLAESGYHWQPQTICQRAGESVARVKQSMNGCLYEMVVGGYGVCMVERTMFH